MRGRSGAPRVTDLDVRIGANARALRVQRGLSQMEFGEMIGITYQQVHKYEKGINRISASRLHQIATALGCDHAVFFEGLDAPAEPLPRTRKTLELVEKFGRMPTRYQDAVAHLVRALNSEEKGH